MVQAGRDWVAHMKQGHLSRAETWVLPALGISRNFPRNTVFAPKAIFWLGFKHLYTVQDNYRLLNIIRHTFHEFSSWLLYLGSIELLHLGLSLLSPFHNIDFSALSILATDSLVKSTWSFLWTSQIQLHTSVTYLLARDNDILLMGEITKGDISTSELGAINKCRLYLQARYLSDIVDGSGTHILQEAWTETHKMHPHRETRWLAQGKPSAQQWAILNLRHPLGPWRSVDAGWEWFYSVHDRRLYQKRDREWSSYSFLVDRPTMPIFSNIGHPAEKLHALAVASVYRKGDKIICSGQGPWIQPPITRTSH